MLYWYKLRVSLLVIPVFLRYILEKFVWERGLFMISEEYYLNFLKCVISCVNNGDYYSIKELSALELEKMKKNHISNGGDDVVIYNFFRLS